MQHGHRQRRRDVEPDRHIHVPLPPFEDGAEQVHAEDHPHQGDEDVNRPLQLGVFLACGITQRQCDRRGNDDGLPAPEVHPAQCVAEHARLAEPLQGIVDPHEHAVADEREDHGIRMHRAQPTEGDELEVQVGSREENLRGRQQARHHADDAPDHGRDGERPHDAVIVTERPPACLCPFELSRRNASLIIDSFSPFKLFNASRL